MNYFADRKGVLYAKINNEYLKLAEGKNLDCYPFGEFFTNRIEYRKNAAYSQLNEKTIIKLKELDII